VVTEVKLGAWVWPGQPEDKGNWPHGPSHNVRVLQPQDYGQAASPPRSCPPWGIDQVLPFPEHLLCARLGV
jgi:hypothetical protein